MFIKMRDHIYQEHKDWLQQWYQLNKQKFYYVKRRCIKGLDGAIVGFWLYGKPAISSITPTQKKVLKSASTYQELDNALKKIADYYSNITEKFYIELRANRLRDWLVEYALKHTVKITINPT